MSYEVQDGVLYRRTIVNGETKFVTWDDAAEAVTDALDVLEAVPEHERVAAALSMLRKAGWDVTDEFLAHADGSTRHYVSALSPERKVEQ